jgi:ribonuclease Z
MSFSVDLENKVGGMEAPAAYVVPLGVSAGLPIPGHANCYVAVVREGRYWLVDCADSPIDRLLQAGLDPLAVQGVIITHFHPDHVYGLPVFLMGLFLLGMQQGRPRREPLLIFARPEVLERVRSMIALYEIETWHGMFPIAYHTIAPEVGAHVVTPEGVKPLFEITAAPSRHSVPSLALRFALPDSPRAFVYSSDTAPCAEVEELASGATLLFHEATASVHGGHSFPADAATAAARAGVERLVLIHYYELTPDEILQMMSVARRAFGRRVDVAQEFQIYPW